jgi:antitoxin PrlF
MRLYFCEADLYCRGMKGVLSSQGQVTIPKYVRDALGLRPGDQIDFRVEGDVLVGRRKPPRESLDRFVGILRDGRSTDEVMSSLRPARAWERR